MGLNELCVIDPRGSWAWGLNESCVIGPRGSWAWGLDKSRVVGSTRPMLDGDGESHPGSERDYLKLPAQLI